MNDKLNRGDDTRGPNLLFYSGDADSRAALSNAYNTGVSDARVYDDVRLRGAWTVDCVFSHNVMNFTGVQQAYVHIIGPGQVTGGQPNGGLSEAYPRTLVSATQTATGIVHHGLTEYEVKACGLGLNLPQGHYYFNVQPVGFGTGLSYQSSTDGKNHSGGAGGTVGGAGKGSPLANDNSWFDSVHFGYTFADTNAIHGAGIWDYSGGMCSAPAC
jgi:hypothetical protein